MSARNTLAAKRLRRGFRAERNERGDAIARASVAAPCVLGLINMFIVTAAGRVNVP